MAPFTSSRLTSYPSSGSACTSRLSPAFTVTGPGGLIEPLGPAVRVTVNCCCSCRQFTRISISPSTVKLRSKRWRLNTSSGPRFSKSPTCSVSISNPGLAVTRRSRPTPAGSTILCAPVSGSTGSPLTVIWPCSPLYGGTVTSMVTACVSTAIARAGIATIKNMAVASEDAMNRLIRPPFQSAY